MSEAGRTTRAQMIERIRQALGRSGGGGEAPQPPAVDEALVRLAGPEEDLPRLFAEQAEGVGMEVRRCKAEGLAGALVGVLEEIDAGRVTLAVDRLGEEAAGAIEAAVGEAGIETADWRGDRAMRGQYEVDAGVTDVHAALAETGSIVCNTDAGHGRGGSLVPPVHVAIVREGDIRADLVDYMASVRGESAAGLPSAQAIITGPSKTADIEGVLITGVHGPGRVMILLVES